MVTIVCLPQNVRRTRVTTTSVFQTVIHHLQILGVEILLHYYTHQEGADPGAQVMCRGRRGRDVHDWRSFLACFEAECLKFWRHLSTEWRVPTAAAALLLLQWSRPAPVLPGDKKAPTASLGHLAIRLLAPKSDGGTGRREEWRERRQLNGREAVPRQKESEKKAKSASSVDGTTGSRWLCLGPI